MDNLGPPDTRARSRSRTPFLRSSCDRELCAHAGEEGHVHKKTSFKSKSPTVRTIIEEEVGISKPANRQVQSSHVQRSKVVTSDYSSPDTSPDVAKTYVGSKTTTVTTKTQTISNNNISSGRGLNALTSGGGSGLSADYESTVSGRRQLGSSSGYESVSSRRTEFGSGGTLKRGDGASSEFSVSSGRRQIGSGIQNRGGGVSSEFESVSSARRQFGSGGGGAIVSGGIGSSAFESVSSSGRRQFGSTGLTSVGGRSGGGETSTVTSTTTRHYRSTGLNNTAGSVGSSGYIRSSEQQEEDNYLINSGGGSSPFTSSSAKQSGSTLKQTGANYLLNEQGGDNYLISSGGGSSSFTSSSAKQSGSALKQTGGSSSFKASSAQQSRAAGLSRSKEISQNEINSAFEESKIQTSTPIYHGAKKINYVSPTNGDLTNHIGYQVYKQSGEYWNKYPKTDYTYSHLSPHRRELAPGVVAMPNMSRRSLEQHHERVHDMIQSNPSQESYIRERYQTTRHTQNNATPVLRKEAYYDSQDEVDLTELDSFKDSYSFNNRYKSNNYDNYRVATAYNTAGYNTAGYNTAGYNTAAYNTAAYNVQNETVVTRVITTIATLFSRFLNIFSSSDENEHMYYTRVDEERGIFSRIASFVAAPILGLFRYMYLLISSILYLDTWLLRSSSPDNRSKKRFLLFLLLLLPLLLLAAWKLMEDQERQALILRIHNSIPLSLLGVRSLLPNNWGDIFKFDLSFLTGQPSSKTSSQYNYASITNNFQNSLSADEYNKLISHIDGYVDQLVQDKVAIAQEKSSQENYGKISNEMSVLIAKIVKENIIASVPPTTAHPSPATIQIQPYELTDADVQRIAELVRIQLTASGCNFGKFTLSQDNLEEITKLIKQNIEINNHSYNIIERIDINELLFKILQSNELQGYIDKKILNAPHINLIDKQQLLIDELNKEIGFIKMKLSEKLNENQDLHYSINILKASHDDLSSSFGIYQKESNEKFNNLLLEIDSKIAGLNEHQFALINKQIKLALVEILGYKNGKSIDEIDLQNWVRNMFVAKEFLEARLLEINLQTNQTLKNEIDQSGMLLMKDINEKLKIQVLKIIEEKQKEGGFVNIGGGGGSMLTEMEIKKIVSDALAVYDADKTGLVDYALESAGGQVLSTRCTESYQTKTAQISIFGIPLWYPSNTPRIAISPAVQPGECWAFQSFPGFLVLRLNTMVFVTGFTMEHIPKSLAPNGKIDSAPKSFTVWGLADENDQEPVKFGEYEYVDNAISLQYFAVQNKEIKRPFDVVELRIETNHGNSGYTCLYRFRVHGSPTS